MSKQIKPQSRVKDGCCDFSVEGCSLVDSIKVPGFKANLILGQTPSLWVVQSCVSPAAPRGVSVQIDGLTASKQLDLFNCDN